MIEYLALVVAYTMLHRLLSISEHLKSPISKWGKANPLDTFLVSLFLSRYLPEALNEACEPVTNYNDNDILYAA